MIAAANPCCRLALRTSPRPCAISRRNSFKATSYGLSEGLVPTPLSHLLIGFHQQRQKHRTQNPSTHYRMLFNIHNPL
jgi:hypothetical protein